MLSRGSHDVVRLRHAVLAAQIAAIGDRDAQAAQRTIEAVESGHRSPSLWHCGDYNLDR